MDTAEHLVGTAAAAATLGITARTLQRYVEQGVVEPAVRLPSGQYRWDPVDLARQITEPTAATARAARAASGADEPATPSPR